MDNLDLTGLRTKTQQATNDLATLQTSVPGMLSDLKSSLASIYAKDNPLIKARDEALSTFLSTPSATRAELLTPNLPMVAGSPLTLSPTQQNAITTSRESAALAPLLGLNQAVLAGYGNIGDIVKGAATGYEAQVEAAKTKANSALNLYQQAIAEYNAATARQESERKSKEGQGGGRLDILAAFKSLRDGQPSKEPNLDDFVEPDPEPIQTPIGPVSFGQAQPVNLFQNNGQLIPGLSGLGSSGGIGFRR